MIGKRAIRQILAAATQKRHYIALLNMARLYPRFFENLRRYLTGRGHYPYDIAIRTPVGVVTARLYSHHDLLTVNEIFCRQDYYADSSLHYAVDFGANIGISALYFMTRNSIANCFLYEPDPSNVAKLKWNLRGYEGRYSVFRTAVSDEAGEFVFGIEQCGRYGGLGLDTGQSIVVTCAHVNDVLEDILLNTAQIDILKIDTEGMEIRTVKSISNKLLECINYIYLEARPHEDLYPSLFHNKQYGSIRQLSKLDG